MDATTTERLLAFVQLTHRRLIAERDCAYDGMPVDEDGTPINSEDRDTLAAIDSDIAGAADLIASAGNTTIEDIEARFAPQALEQLRQELMALSCQMEQLRSRLSRAEQDAHDAERLADHFLDMLNETDAHIGITTGGDIGLIEVAQ